MEFVPHRGTSQYAQTKPTFSGQMSVFLNAKARGKVTQARGRTV